LVEQQANRPLLDPYWRSKSSALERVEVPTFVVARATNPLQPRGTLEGFKRIGSNNKWLRVHDTFEWPDYQSPTSRADLKRFFDRYLKDISYDWEQTPKVRLSLLDSPAGNVYRNADSWLPKIHSPSDVQYSRA
jgi:uncharacterized protein